MRAGYRADGLWGLGAVLEFGVLVTEITRFELAGIHGKTTYSD